VALYGRMMRDIEGGGACIGALDQARALAPGAGARMLHVGGARAHRARAACTRTDTTHAHARTHARTHPHGQNISRHTHSRRHTSAHKHTRTDTPPPQACYALGYNLAIEYLADYEKTWMLDSFRWVKGGACGAASGGACGEAGLVRRAREAAERRVLRRRRARGPLP
jgi:hypothetical protein